MWGVTSATKSRGGHGESEALCRGRLRRHSGRLRKEGLTGNLGSPFWTNFSGVFENEDEVHIGIYFW